MPPEVREVRQALQMHGMEFVNALLQATRKGNWAAAAKALEWILGKPSQPVELGGSEAKPIEVVQPNYVETFIARFNARLASEVSPGPEANGNPKALPNP
jgi:hypothetical protein